MALNYLVFLRYTAGQNSQTINDNRKAAGGNRRLNTFDKLGGSEFAGVEAGGLTDKEFIDELCNGIRLAILEEQQIGNYLFVPECRVLIQKSDNKDDNGDVVVYNSFSKFKSYRLDDADTDKIKMTELKSSQEATKKKLTFKND